MTRTAALNLARCAALSLGLALTLASGSTPALAQFAPPPASSGPKLPPVTVFPPAGVYTNTTGIALRHPDPTVEIRYTLDGSVPTASSAKLKPDQNFFLTGVYDGDKGLTTGYTVRAVAAKPGMSDSDPVTFSYSVARRDRTAYVSEEVLPGVRMIRDSDNDKMFLIRGTKAYALIDSGLGRGDLKGYLSQFTGGLPIVAIATHSHGDHVGQMSQFVGGGKVYVGADDRASVAAFFARQGAAQAAIDANLTSVQTGDRIDLGDRALEIYSLAGHTPGSIVILDPASGALFTGDSVGNNSPLPPDVMWMQGYQRPLDVYFANVRTARAALGDRVKYIVTGHNDRPLVGTAYLDNLEKALQRAMDQGEGALIPSWRPQGIVQVVEGDRFSDPNWFGVNVNRQTFMSAAPDQLAGLTGLTLTGARLVKPLDPSVHELSAVRTGGGRISVAATPTSSRSAKLTIDGRPVAAGRAVAARAGRPIPIVVTAPDGRTTAAYTLTIR